MPSKDKVDRRKTSDRTDRWRLSGYERFEIRLTRDFDINDIKNVHILKAKMFKKQYRSGGRYDRENDKFITQNLFPTQEQGNAGYMLLSGKDTNTVLNEMKKGERISKLKKKYQSQRTRKR